MLKPLQMVKANNAIENSSQVRMNPELLVSCSFSSLDSSDIPSSASSSSSSSPSISHSLSSAIKRQSSIDTQTSIPTSSSIDFRECDVCLQKVYYSKCVKSSDFCLEKDCDGCFCQDCIQDYFKEKIESNLGYVIRINCPCCPSVVPIKHWRSYISDHLFDRLLTRAKGTMSYRCNNCDGTLSFLEDAPLDSFLEATSVYEYCDYLLTKEEIPEDIEAEKQEERAVAGSSLEPQKNQTMLRTAKKGTGSISSLIQQFENMCQQYSDLPPPAPVVSSSSRVSPSVRKYENHNSRELYSDIFIIRKKYFLKEINADQVIDALQKLNLHTLHQLVRQVIKYFSNDHLDLRVSLVSRGLQRLPIINTSCCSTPFCMDCHSGHTGSCPIISEDTVMESIRSCPNCNIKLMKTDGCSDVFCVCRHSFDWNDVQHLKFLEPNDKDALDHS